LQPHFSVRRVPHHGAKLETIAQGLPENAPKCTSISAPTGYGSCLVKMDKPFALRSPRKHAIPRPAAQIQPANQHWFSLAFGRSSISIPWRA